MEMEEQAKLSFSWLLNTSFSLSTTFRLKARVTVSKAMGNRVTDNSRGMDSRGMDRCSNKVMGNKAMGNRAMDKKVTDNKVTDNKVTDNKAINREMCNKATDLLIKVAMDHIKAIKDGDICLDR